MNRQDQESTISSVTLDRNDVNTFLSDLISKSERSKSERSHPFSGGRHK